MRNGLLLLASAGLLAACGGGMPNFVGRSGGDGTYRLGGEPLPDPVPVAMRSATAERGLYGVIVRVDAESPTQGYWGAALEPLGNGDPDAAGVVGFRLVAMPPPAPEGVGPARTRALSAAIFIPNLALKHARGARIAAANRVETVPLPAPPAPQPIAAEDF